MRWRVFPLLGILAGLFIASAATPLAWADDSTTLVRKDVHALIVTGEYGILAGTVLGAATLPFTQNLRSLFIGSSLGLYLGIVVGIYYIANRDNPENPLKNEEERYPDPGASSQLRLPLSASKVVQVSMPLLRF